MAYLRSWHSSDSAWCILQGHCAPPPDGHGDTAHAIQVAREAAELFDFPMAGRLIPGLLRGDDPDEAPVHAPTNNVHIRTQSLHGIRQHKNGEEQEFDDFPVLKGADDQLLLHCLMWTGLVNGNSRLHSSCASKVIKKSLMAHFICICRLGSFTMKLIQFAVIPDLYD